MNKFPSINQFANVIRHVKQQTRFAGLDADGNPTYNANPLPTIRYLGTVKLHGTNASIVLDITGELTYQSRERVLSIGSDNAGFMLAMSQHTDQLKDLFKTVAELSNADNVAMDKLIIFGEWCAGNIQKGVSISGLEKMFVIFSAGYIMDNMITWLPRDQIACLKKPDIRIFNIMDYETFSIDIDFEHPEIAQNKIVAWVEAVEKECPVGKAFGRVFGQDNTIGEGIVFGPEDDRYKDSGYWFKSKGEKHSASKVKTIAAVDVEMINSVNEFVDMFVTENRLEQMLDRLQRELLLPFEMKSMGDFIRLVYADVIKEGEAEIVENQIDPKKLGSQIATTARRWFITKFNESV